MKKSYEKDHASEMLDEYNFKSGIRGKYVKRYKEGSNVIVLDPDVAKVFPDRESVNKSLRALADIIHLQQNSSRASKFYKTL